MGEKDDTQDRVLCEPAAGISIRYRCMSGRYPHRVICLPDQVDDDVLLDVLDRMHNALAFDGLREKRDFRWRGFSVVEFRSKGRAAILALELSAQE